jgi:predicted molibdopterin-dependent oxidoreductase YjgC
MEQCMVTITVNEQRFDVETGRPLVEVIKDLGFYISNLCYVDGLPPYAGCRTCVVEVEGMRGLPLACSTPVQDGMVVRTDTPAVTAMRQEVMSLILANHPDRCLTCHRVEHCRTGDICLRDNVVTHRCVTCSKNYRCELQTASDIADIGRANVEPYLDESRTFAQSQQPDPDRNNPFFEFDPQMCILCTRCERVCADLRHTTAISLAGRGFSTRIAFGSGGTIDESNCDFCGSCIDACPTATLMEAPNKWVARPEQWVTTTCMECSLGCSIQLGVKNGRGVIVRPGSGNDVSRDQICVRGRFGYDQIRDKHRLQNGRLGRGEDAADTDLDAVLDDAAQTLAAIIAEHGAEAVGVLGSGQATNEDNFLVRQLADQIGTPHVDSSGGHVWGAVANALIASFGTEHLPNRLTDVERAKTIVAIGNDLSASNNVVGVRIKDAVAQGARLVTVSARRNPIDDHATVSIRSPQGDIAATVQALAGALLRDESVAARVVDVDGGSALASVATAGVEDAVTILASADVEGVAVVVAPSRHNAAIAAAQAQAAANLAILLAGADGAPSALHVLPPESNSVGARDMGIVPGAEGMTVLEMMDAARERQLKAMIIVGDNPSLHLPNRTNTRSALDALDLLLVIDEVETETVERATHVVPDVGPFAKDGTITNADRQILRLRAATTPQPAASPAWTQVAALASRLAAVQNHDAPTTYADAAAVMSAIASANANYRGAKYTAMARPTRQPTNGASSQAFQPIPPPAASNGALVLLSGRELYTDRTAAAANLDDADRIGRGEYLEIHPADAASRNVGDGETVRITSGAESISMKARVTEDVPEGAVFMPLLWNRGAVQALLSSDADGSTVEVSPA